MIHFIRINESFGEVLHLRDGISIEMRLKPGTPPEFYLLHSKIGEIKLDDAQQAFDEIEYLYDEILKKIGIIPKSQIKIFFKRSQEKADKLKTPPEPSPPPPPKNKGAITAFAHLLQPAFEVAREYNKAFIVKQRADLGPQFTHSKVFKHVNWHLQYFVSFGYVKGIGVFLKIELRGKGRKPKQMFFRTSMQGLTPEEMAEQLVMYNVRFKEMKDFLDFAEKKKGRKLKGLKPGTSKLTKYQKVSDKAALRARQRSKVLGKDVSLDEPVDVRRFRSPDDTAPTHQFQTTSQGRQRFGAELSSPSAATAPKKSDDSPAQEKHKLTQKQADYSYKYFQKLANQKQGSTPSANYLTCSKCRYFTTVGQSEKVGLEYSVDKAAFLKANHSDRTKLPPLKPWENGPLIIVPGRRFLAGGCELVRGKIHPMATCKLWASKSMGERDARIDLAGKVYAALMDFYGDDLARQEKEYFGESKLGKPSISSIEKQLNILHNSSRIDPDLLQDFAITIIATQDNKLEQAGKKLIELAKEIRKSKPPDTTGMDPKQALKTEFKWLLGFSVKFHKIMGKSDILGFFQRARRGWYYRGT